MSQADRPQTASPPCEPHHVSRRALLRGAAASLPAEGAPVEVALLEAVLTIDRAMRATMRRYADIGYARVFPTATRGSVDLVWRTAVPSISGRAVRVAMTGLAALMPEPYQAAWVLPKAPFKVQLAKLRKRALRRQWSTTTAVLALAARRRGLPLQPMGDAYLRIGQGARQHIVNASTTGFTTFERRPRRDHWPTHARRLEAAGLPVLASGDATEATELLGLRRFRLLMVGSRLVAALEERPVAGTGSVETSDVTDQVHGETSVMAERAAAALERDVVGIEFLARSIALPPGPADARIACVTTRPDLLAHVFPDDGKPRDVGGAILDLVYPPGESVRIPSVIVAGARGTATVGRDLDAIMRMSGRVPGLSTSRRTTVGGEPMEPGSAGRLGALRFLVNDPRVDSLVATIAPRQLLGRGLLLDSCCTAAIMEAAAGDDEPTHRRAMDIILRATRGPVVVLSGGAMANAVLARRGPDGVILIAIQADDPTVIRHRKDGGVVLLATRQDETDRIELWRGDAQVTSFPGAAPGKGGNGTRQRRNVRRMQAIGLALGAGLPVPDIESATARLAYVRR